LVINYRYNISPTCEIMTYWVHNYIFSITFYILYFFFK
jgi:hypothetical protein